MTELDRVWAQMLSAAAETAAGSGRGDIADYLRLKASNDAIRMAGVNWLFDSVIEIALDAGISHPHLTVERVEPHSFERGTSRMAGSLISVSLGVRCLKVQAGWTRTPADGVMRLQALAAADILHFGMSRSNAELRLVRTDTLPRWLDADGQILDLDRLRQHIDILLA